MTQSGESASVAALFVESGGVYFDLPDVDPWDQARDARLYDGPLPVVAHPPCARWCNLAALVEHVHGHRRGEDGGCFAAALAAVRVYGGVLEHPAYSLAWPRFGLPRPRRGYWTSALDDRGWVIQFDQGAYGVTARKATWLYAVDCELPELRQLSGPPPAGGWIVSANTRPYLRGRSAATGRLRDAGASRTPLELRDVLLGMARSVHGRRALELVA